MKQTMKIGARAHDFGKLPAAELAKSLREAGFDSAQLAPPKAIAGVDSIFALDQAGMRAIAKAFAEENVAITLLGCYIEPSLEDERKREHEIEKFLHGIRLAAAAGIPLIGTETTRFLAAEQAREPAYQRLLDSVKIMVAEAEKEAVSVAIEPVADHTLASARLARRLLDEIASPRLKIIFDPVNMLLAADDNQRDIFAEFIALLGEDIVALHMKDIVFEANEKIWRGLGEGIVDYELIFPWPREHKPELPLFREHVKKSSAACDIEFMRRQAQV